MIEMAEKDLEELKIKKKNYENKIKQKGKRPIQNFKNDNHSNE